MDLGISGDTVMHWRFDPKNRHLEPLDNSATNLTLLHSNRDLVTATLPPVAEPAPVYTEDRYEKQEEHTASVLDLVEELRARRAMQEQPTIKPAPAKAELLCQVGMRLFWEQPQNPILIKGILSSASEKAP